MSDAPHANALNALDALKWLPPLPGVTVVRDRQGLLAKIIDVESDVTSELMLSHRFDYDKVTSQCAAIATQNGVEQLRVSATIEWKDQWLIFAASARESRYAFSVSLRKKDGPHAPIYVSPKPPLGIGGALDLTTGVPTIDLALSNRLPSALGWLTSGMGSQLIAENVRLIGLATAAIRQYASGDLDNIVGAYWFHIMPSDEVTMGSVFSEAELGIRTSIGVPDTPATSAFVGILWRICALDFEPTFIASLQASGRGGGLSLPLDPKTLKRVKTDN